MCCGLQPKKGNTYRLYWTMPSRRFQQELHLRIRNEPSGACMKTIDKLMAGNPATAARHGRAIATRSPSRPRAPPER